MKLFSEVRETEETVVFFIVEENSIVEDSSEKELNLLESGLKDLNTAIKVASQYAKYYDVFYPTFLKKIIHQ